MTATTAGVAAVLVLVAGTYGSFTRRTQRVSEWEGVGETARPKALQGHTLLHRG